MSTEPLSPPTKHRFLWAALLVAVAVGAGSVMVTGAGSHSHPAAPASPSAPVSVAAASSKTGWIWATEDACGKLLEGAKDVKRVLDAASAGTITTTEAGAELRMAAGALHVATDISGLDVGNYNVLVTDAEARSGRIGLQLIQHGSSEAADTAALVRDLRAAKARCHWSVLSSETGP